MKRSVTVIVTEQARHNAPIHKKVSAIFCYIKINANDERLQISSLPPLKNKQIKLIQKCSSSLIGGYLGDYYESEKGGKKLYMKGYIAGFGALIGCIFIPTCYLISINFWVSLVSLYFVTLTS